MAENDNKPRKPNKPAKKSENMHYSAAARPQVSDVIGRRLKTYYDELAAQPIPDRFLELLAKLESTSPPKKKAD